MIFYDPADFAAVAKGLMNPWEPQPYAELNLDQYLFHVQSDQQKGHLGEASFDRGRGLLYVFEPLADGDKPLIHVWQVCGS
jgi:RimJ/RimL family protein N-acetyltransferase